MIPFIQRITILKSLLNVTDYDNDEGSCDDWPDLGIDRLLAKKLNDLPVRDKYLHYSGFIKGPIGSVCKSFDVDVDGIPQRISISTQTKNCKGALESGDYLKYMQKLQGKLANVIHMDPDDSNLWEAHLKLTLRMNRYSFLCERGFVT